MKKYIILLSLLLLLPTASYAHSGGTDGNGGHNSSTGYHYHHGYPAHQHENGQCPYEFDDKTGWNSGSSTEAEEKTDDNIIEKTNETEKENRQNKSLLHKILGALSCASVISLTWCFIFCFSAAIISFVSFAIFKSDFFKEEKAYPTALPISILITAFLQNKFHFAETFNHPALAILFLPAGIVSAVMFFMYIYTFCTTNNSDE
jgi:hypothetical protein